MTDVNIAHLLARPLAEQSATPAVVDPDGTATTFAALDAMSRRMQSCLQGDGMRAGDHVLFFAAPSARLYAALIAVWRMGAVATFVEPSAGRGVLDAACALCNPRALVATPKAHLLRIVSSGLRSIPNHYVLSRGLTPFGRSLNSRLPVPASAIAHVAEHEAALLTFTSGSTGSPKGAVRTHGILRAQMDALTDAFAARATEVEMVALPIVVLLNLANGATTVLPDADLRKPAEIDAHAVLRQIMGQPPAPPGSVSKSASPNATTATTTSVTRIVASPAFLERLVAHRNAPRAMGRLRTIVTGGGPVFPDLTDRLAHLAPSAAIIAVYGSTEAEPIAHIAHGDISLGDRREMQRGGGLLTGMPVPQVTLRLLRADLGPLHAASAVEIGELTVAAGEPGEIVVAGAHVVTGYHRGVGDAETKIRVGNTIWHRTGDLGRLDDTGRLWLLGRVDAAAFDSRGEFYPFAVECAARLILPGHHMAALMHEHRRTLVVESAAAETPSFADALARLRTALAWAHLDDLRTLPQIPMDRRHNSKVDYPALRRRLR